MRCDKCHEFTKPVVVFDVDGTLANYHEHLRIFCNKYWNMETWRSKPWDGEGEYEDWLGLTKAQYREAKLAYRQGGQKRMMPGYSDMIALARWVGLNRYVDLWVCTTRPWQRLDNVDPDTRFWLERMGINYKHLLFGDDKYADLRQQLDPDRVLIVVEDLKEMVSRAQDFFYPAIQIARDHNAHASVSHPDRVESAQVVQQVENLLSKVEQELIAT